MMTWLILKSTDAFSHGFCLARFSSAGFVFFSLGFEQGCTVWTLPNGSSDGVGGSDSAGSWGYCFVGEHLDTLRCQTWLVDPQFVF